MPFSFIWNSSCYWKIILRLYLAYQEQEIPLSFIPSSRAIALLGRMYMMYDAYHMMLPYYAFYVPSITASTDVLIYIHCSFCLATMPVYMHCLLPIHVADMEILT